MNNELKSIRYMLNNLILRVWDLQQQVEIITQPKREYKISEPNVGGNDIAFDLFTLPRKKYEEFIDKYGVDITKEGKVYATIPRETEREMVIVHNGVEHKFTYLKKLTRNGITTLKDKEFVEQEKEQKRLEET